MSLCGGLSDVWVTIRLGREGLGGRSQRRTTSHRIVSRAIPVTGTRAPALAGCGVLQQMKFVSSLPFIYLYQCGRKDI